MGALKDLTGQRFGKLKVISLGDKINGKVAWNCICNCGNDCLVRTTNLKQGTKSCGKCSNNKFEFDGDTVIGTTSNGKTFMFGKRLFPKVKKHSWFINNNGYLYTTIDKKKIGLHKLVTNTDSKTLIDHIDGNKSDNRLINLRICSSVENGQNSKKPKNNTSGYKGVYFNKKNRKWISEIQVNKKRINLGSYEDLYDAVKARVEAEIKYFGSFRYKGEDENILKILKNIGEM